MTAFRFIHTSDLHLGRRFGNLPEDVRGRLVEARHGALDALAEAARGHGAAHVLVAGDLFDSETPSDPVWRQALTAMAEDSALHWWIIPGNHDSLAAEALWDRIREQAPGNVRVLDRPEPVEITPGVMLLPSPAPRRHPGRDLTEWMASAETQDGDFRIGLAHGGVQTFGSEDDGAEIIPPDRPETAGLDYLALGDWHGRLRITDRAHYSGSPERDRFKHAGRGVCLAVTLGEPGAPPHVEEIETGRFDWADVSLALTPGDDPVEALARTLPSEGRRRRDTLVRLRMSGWIHLDRRLALSRAVADVAPEFCHFDSDESGLATEYRADDLDEIDVAGALRLAADDLLGGAQDNALDEGARAVADAALNRLYSLVKGDFGMKIRAIRLENVRRFTDPVEIAGIGDGLNVLSAPNEHGKSTVFDALHAVFFKDRKSWDKEVRSLAPHAGGDPTVGVDVEIGGATFRVEKRWSKSRNGDVRIWSSGRLLKQADEAEEWLSAALRAPNDGGPAGLLWVRQGLSGLKDNGEAGRVARRDLMSSVAGEVEAMTGGRRMELALRHCEVELTKYLTKAEKKARRDGPLKEQQDLVAELEQRRADLSETAATLREELERRRRLRRDLADLEAPEAEAERQRRLADARARFEEAQRHAERLERAEENERTARRATVAARESLDRLESAFRELRAAGKEVSAAEGEATETAEQLGARTARAEEAETTRGTARAAAERAAEALRRATRAEAAEVAAFRRAELTEKLERAEALREAIEKAAAEAKQGVTAAKLENLEALDGDVRAAKRAVEAAAASVSIDYEAGSEGSVTIDGAPLEQDVRRPAIGTTRIDIAGVGRLTVHPGVGGDATAVTAAETALRSALDKAGVESLDAARASALARTEAEERRRSAQAAFDALAPKGVEQLRATLAALPAPREESDDTPDVETAQKADAAARRELQDAELAFEKAQAARGAAQNADSIAKTTLEAARNRLERATAVLAGVDDAEAELEARNVALSAAEADLAAAETSLKGMAEGAPDLEAATAALERAGSVVQRADEDRQRLRIDLGKLDTSIEHHAGEAVEEELADTEAQLAKAQKRLSEIEFEVAVLQRLRSALEAARALARDRYVEPIKRELVPLLRLLWDDSELRFNAEDVLPTSLVRDGEEEDFSVLSGGTQEQIALLVRLAFARLLAQAGDPAPVILDDAIVYTDDDRIERMFDALTRQAQDIQILVFSCRQKAFRDLGGRSLAIGPATSATEAAE